MKAFEEEVFSLELVKPDCIHHEDGVVVDILEAGECDEHLSVIINIIIHVLARTSKPMLPFYWWFGLFMLLGCRNPSTLSLVDVFYY